MIDRKKGLNKRLFFDTIEKDAEHLVYLQNDRMLRKNNRIWKEKLSPSRNRRWKLFLIK